MKLERFTNPYELEDYLKVMILSMYDGKRKHKPITRFFRQEITRAFEHTAKLDDNYEINKGNWVLYALRNDYNEIADLVRRLSFRRLRSAGICRHSRGLPTTRPGKTDD